MLRFAMLHVCMNELVKDVVSEFTRKDAGPILAIATFLTWLMCVNKAVKGKQLRQKRIERLDCESILMNVLCPLFHGSLQLLLGIVD